MQMNLDMMQIVLRQILVLIMVLAVIVQLATISWRRRSLILERQDGKAKPDKLRVDQR
jgi:hypothetical protein